MKLLSEKLKSQIGEARAIVEKENAEAQALAGADDVDPGKAIGAIEKAQGKAKAAELVIKSLESKLALALKEEARAAYNEITADAINAAKAYAKNVQPEYTKIRQGLMLVIEAIRKLENMRVKLYQEVGPAYENGQAYGAILESLTAYPTFKSLSAAWNLDNIVFYGKEEKLFDALEKELSWKEENSKSISRYFKPFEVVERSQDGGSA